MAKTMLEQQAELAEANRQARIRRDAEHILKAWVSMTPTATPQFVIDNSAAALAAAEQLFETTNAMTVAPLPPVVVP